MVTDATKIFAWGHNLWGLCSCWHTRLSTAGQLTGFTNCCRAGADLVVRSAASTRYDADVAKFLLSLSRPAVYCGPTCCQRAYERRKWQRPHPVDLLSRDINTVQVKDVQGNITLRSGDVVEAIDNAWAHRQRNPTRPI